MQKSTTPAVAPEFRFRMRVLVGDKIAIGPGKIELLQAIAEHHSISAAAKSLQMSYRRAWLLVDELNRALIGPVVTTAAGGAGGGGAALTPLGEEVLSIYRSIEARAAQSCAGEIDRLLDCTRRA